MKNKKILKLAVLGFLAFPLFLCSCEEEMTDDSHYKVPSWLKGNAYEQLQKEGNYSIFLEGVDLAGFNNLVSGKGLVTVMAPNDEAFQHYLQKKGYSSIKEMYDAEPKEVVKLMGFHLMYYAYDWKKLVNFRPVAGDGATEEQENMNAGFYFKHRTRSSEAMTQEFNPVLNQMVNVYHFERLLPVFSNRLYETLGIDPKYNYEYFYPNSTWTGSRAGGGFNVANASVTDTVSIVTDNGYLYHVDQVLEPIESVYMTLKNNPDYSKYIELYDTYSYYVEEPNLTTDFGNGFKIYLHYHNGLPTIASEWYDPDYRMISINSSAGHNIFVPSNDAIEHFFQIYWTADGGYTSFDELDPLIKQYFIEQTFTEDIYPVFPEWIKMGLVNTKFGTPVNIDPDEVTDRHVCTNGFLYGMDEMAVPAIFSSVAGPAFNNKAYRNYLYALDASTLVQSLASQQIDFVALFPDTTKFIAANMPILKSGTGYALNVWDDINGVYQEISSSRAQDIVNMHVASGISELPEQGVAVIETNVPFNYLYVKDGAITTNVNFNNYLNPNYSDDPFVPFHKIYEGDNGTSYSYEGTEIFQTDASDGLEHVLSICNDVNYSYYLFSQLLQKSGLAVEGKLPSLINADSRFIVFVPTNDAIKNKLDEIPGTTGLSIADDYRISGSLTPTRKTQLANYLRSFFITSTMTPFTKYPYPGAGVQGEFMTFGTNSLYLIDNASSLQVKFADGESTAPVNVIDDYGYLPFAFKDGCFHLIEDILK